ncbi:hypothetical protein Cri9333_1740 [Crinalium epipsammum PCC 9333]|uniref:Uncharacterized protein n=1 Tax=Crinalium epipsammum PCC 9333 TaxID=1173022 RepID=K9VZP4_9CYAN|nr:hypothetical protein [Crinalium epipsammum]AFZ12625.1 hypothetical protein Cri9333_1740 [Crinalium epipsammum PCC 9333]
MKFNKSKTAAFFVGSLIGILIPFLPVIINAENSEKTPEQKEGRRDYLAIGVNAGTIITCALGIAGTIWTVSKKNTEAEFKVKQDLSEKLNGLEKALDEKVKKITDISFAKNEENLQRDLNTKSQAATSVAELKMLFLTTTNNTELAIAELRRDLEKSISVNFGEIVKVHNNLNSSIFEIEAHMETQDKIHKEMSDKLTLTNELAEQRHINGKGEMQLLLRAFHYRLADIEKTLETKHGFSPRRDPINYDIESLG